MAPRINVVGSASAAAESATRPAPAGSTAGPVFPAVSPTPVGTCAPDDLLRLVDKDPSSALPADYVPADLVALKPIDASPGAAQTLKLRQPAADALDRMLADARATGVYLLAQSTYRSYEDQGRVYQAEVEHFGQARADRESARPGHSEHQLGTAVDFTTKSLAYDLNDSFAATPEGRWLQQHAGSYGWVLSYPQDKEVATGYMYEPWHYRFVGVEAAQAFARSGLVLSEWLRSRQLGCQL